MLAPQPFEFSLAMSRLCADIAARLDELAETPDELEWFLNRIRAAA